MTNFKIEDRPIAGDVNYRERRAVDQKTPAEFLAALDAVLDQPGVEAVKWTQYTPYFMDGDPCEFGVNDFRVRIIGDREDSGDYEDGFRENFYDYGKHTTYKDRPEYPTYTRYNYNSPETIAYTAKYQEWSRKFYADDNRVFIEIPGGDVEAIVEALSNLNGSASAFEAVLESSFGDHAEVTATKDGFNVEYFEHD